MDNFRGKDRIPFEAFEKDAPFAINSIYTRVKKRAEKKHILCSLSEADFIKLIFSNCNYCGKEPSNLLKYRTDCISKDIYYSGIDRIDSTKGYVLENCNSCCWECNRIKGSEMFDDFIERMCRIDRNFESIGDIKGKIDQWQKNIQTFLAK